MRIVGGKNQVKGVINLWAYEKLLPIKYPQTETVTATVSTAMFREHMYVPQDRINQTHPNRSLRLRGRRREESISTAATNAENG